MGRGDLSNEEWARLEPHLPANHGRGGRWQCHRRTPPNTQLRIGPRQGGPIRSSELLKIQGPGADPHLDQPVVVSGAHRLGTCAAAARTSARLHVMHAADPAKGLQPDDPAIRLCQAARKPRRIAVQPRVTIMAVRHSKTGRRAHLVVRSAPRHPLHGKQQPMPGRAGGGAVVTRTGVGRSRWPGAGGRAWCRRSSRRFGAFRGDAGG